MGWLRNLIIVLKAKRIACVHSLNPQLLMPLINIRGHIRSTWMTMILPCALCSYLSPKLKKQHKAMDVYTIVYHLRELFDKWAKSKRFEVSELIFPSKIVKGTSPVHHALKMNGFIETLDHLGFEMDHELSIDLILASLPNSFA